MSKPGELYMVTEIPNNLKFICFNNIVKHGPSSKPICRQPIKMQKSIKFLSVIGFSYQALLIIVVYVFLVLIVAIFLLIMVAKNKSFNRISRSMNSFTTNPIPIPAINRDRTTI